MRWLWLILLVLSTTTLAGCELAADIFRAGVWVGVLVVVLLLAGIGFVVVKLRR